MSSMAELISVISPSYCHPKSLNLQIDTQNCAAYDEKGNPVFSLNKDELTLHHRRVLYDDKGNPIVTLYKKIENNMGFNVWIEPNVDSAFIVALIMIIMEDWKGLKLMHTTGKVVGGVAGEVAGEVVGTVAVAGLAAAGVPWLLPNQGGEEGGGREEDEEGEEEEGGEEENVD
ncbi:hypothetical protein Fmac_032291 [Flemingia macrophylla]|uniref:Uncharacterized protein n=1 Tax=Flemingia macrophylla TaxID=520843 RepID=A0ABD1L4I2_9FABA